MSEGNSVVIRPILSQRFHFKPQRNGGTRGKVRGSATSAGFISNPFDICGDIPVWNKVKVLTTGTKQVQLNQHTSLIISISLKVKRSSQSTFTMWPCRWAFVSWMERESEEERRRKNKKKKVYHNMKYKKIKSEVKVLWQQNWSQHGG